MDLAELAKLRRDYESAGIDESQLPPQPLQLWENWLADAEAAGIAEINAMVVSTVDDDGTPSSRTVLCKGASADGFVFFTNYHSRKSVAIAANSKISLLFPWHPLARQVIVSGVATRTSREVSEAYFATRPRGSQIGAWASPQSSVIQSRQFLEQEQAELEARFDGQQVPCPPHWGGFEVVPHTVEFWQGRAGRLHDRIRYRTTDSGGWRIDRLAP